MTLPGKEAYFLAGGEFPYPTVQGGSSSGAVSIVFKEFGIRLKFTPNIARNGAIRLKVAPEVSSLDFANGLTIQGFQIPSLRTRRAETEVELREGQYLAIAGLMDNETTRNLTKIPIPGRHSDPGRVVQVSWHPRPPDGAPRGGDPGAGPGLRYGTQGADRASLVRPRARTLWKREGSLKGPSSSSQNPLQPGTSTPSQQPQK